jgi:hypothetical protein
MPVLKLRELCDAIEAGYAAGKSGMDDDMLPLILELADRTAEIKTLIDPFTSADDAEAL